MGFERIPPRLTELLGGLHWNPPLPSTPVKPQTPASKVPSEQLVEKISVNFAAAGATIAKLLQGPGRNPRLRRKVLGWITSEAVATALYGANWGSLVNDVPDPFFVNYTVGDPIVIERGRHYVYGALQTSECEVPLA